MIIQTNYGNSQLFKKVEQKQDMKRSSYFGFCRFLQSKKKNRKKHELITFNIAIGSV